MFKSGDSHAVSTWKYLYMESFADQTDNFANAFVRKNVL